MTGKKYLRRKRILGVSAIVLAMLLMALPVFSRAVENVNYLNASFEGCKTIAEMCDEKGYSPISGTMMMIDKVECVSAKEGEGWVQISEDIYIKLDNYILSIYVPSGVEKIIPNTCKEMFFYFGSGNDTQRSFYRAQSFDVNAFISKLDTSSVTDMSRMFQAVRRAQTLEVTGFNTSNVTDMSFMFMGCDDLQSLDLTGFNTDSVTNMQQMFDTCQSLQTLDLSSFETSRVTSMSYMFCDCSNLETLNLSNFTVTDACDVDNMLTGCSKLNIIHTPTSTAKEIALPDTYYHLQEDGTWEMDGENKKAYTSIPVNNTEADCKSMILIKDDAFPTITPGTLVTIETTLKPGPDVRQAIRSLYNNEHKGELTSIVWNSDAQNGGTVISVDGATYPVYIKVAPDDYSKLYVYSEAAVINANEDSHSMFNDYPAGYFLNLETIDNEFMERLNTSDVTKMQFMFDGCTALKSLNLSSFDTSNVKSFQDMFKNCASLTSITFGTDFNTDSASNLYGMFEGCSALTNLDTTVLTKASNPTAVTASIENLFKGCSSLKRIDLGSFVVYWADNGYQSSIFEGCTALEWVKVNGSFGMFVDLPYDDFVEDLGDGAYGSEQIGEIPFFGTGQGQEADSALSKAYIRKTVIPSSSPSPETSQAAEVSPSPEVTGAAETSPTVSPSPEVTGAAVVSPSPVVTVTPIPSPVTTPTPKPTQNTGKGTLVIVDNRADQTGTDQIAATVSNLVGNLKLIIEDDDGADIKKIQPLKKGQILIPYDIYLIDSYGNRYTNFGSCTITLPIPDSLDLTKGTLTVVAAKSSNVLENVSSTKLVKANINCVQFTATHFSEYGLLWTPYTELTGAVSPSVTPSGTTPKTTAEAATAAAKATSSASGSGSSGSSSSGSSSSSSASSSSGTTSRGYTVVPVAGVKGYSNAKDMPKTGDGDVYRILGAIILFLFGAIELISSIRVKNAE